MNNHIRQNHPNKTNEENWSIFESIGNLKDYSSENDHIPKILKDIGLGASLYLLTLKSFARLFLILCFINLPLCILYSMSTSDS